MPGRMVEVRQPNRRPLYVLVRDQLDLGRDCDGLILADATSSRCHARLEVVESGLQVVDLDSTNGTLVNGARLTGPAVLRPGDVVTIGSTQLSLYVDDDGQHRPVGPRAAQPTLRPVDLPPGA